MEKNWQYTVGPDLADSWNVSADQMTYTYNLVQNATWSDGVPFTSADVVYSFGPQGPNTDGIVAFSSTVNSTVASVTAPNNYTVVFNMRHPVNTFDWNVLMSTVWVYPEHTWNGTNWEGTQWESSSAAMHPVGTGPFTLQNYVQGSSYTLVKNTHYFKAGLPYLNEIIGQIYDDPNAATAALESGSVDYLINEVPAADISSIVSNPNLGYAEAGNQGTDWYLLLNFRNPIIDNLLVRQALYLAINTSQISQDVFFGTTTPPTGIFNSNAPYYVPTSIPSFNPAMAEQLLNQAGYPVQANGSRFSLKMITWNEPDILQTSQLIVQWLKNVGINVNLVSVDKNTMISDTWTSPWSWDLSDIGTYPGGGPTPDSAARTFSDSTFDFSSVGGVPFTNGGAFHNATIDQLWAEAAYQINNTQRIQTYATLQQDLTDQLPYLVLAQGNFPQVYNKAFVGIPYAFISWSMFNSAATVWYNGTSSSTASTSITNASIGTTSTTTTSTSSSSSSTASTVYIGVGIVVVIVIAGAAYFATRRKK
jgi:peptide/nickel transport system substrate-binding protein